MRRIYFISCKHGTTVKHDKAKLQSSLRADRFRNILLSCVLSYVVARLVVTDAGLWHPSLPADATALGEIIAVAGLPAMVLACFGMRTRYRGFTMVCATGCVAVLCLVVLA
ncbi:hypothetical protein GXY_03403 [Novacetimonas hansenii ATCC 23769]|uniref:Uncharacterized protein n=1 Tax=Novacetimonas hansenii ATCC 23769 TaxID=714995 RepID=D5QC34_NOVHA|nr:hypothetical protein GXY_03403 [Novacetimonas hansenii ATCC 23769]PYD72508.1 hypothetical protein CFR74_09290 [Novacetimonas hansenii]